MGRMYLIGIYTCVFLWAGFVFAEQDHKGEVFLQESFEVFQEEDHFVEGDSNLELEHRELYWEVSDLHNLVNKKKAYLKLLKNNLDAVLEINEKPRSDRDEKKQEQILKDKILLKQSKISYLQDKVLEMDESNYAWELKLDLLSQRKKEHRIRREKLQAQIMNSDDQDLGDRDGFGKEINFLQAKRNHLSLFQKNSKPWQDSTRTMKDLNKEMEEKVTATERMLNLIHREWRNLYDKQTLVDRSLDRSLEKKQEEVWILQDEMVVLEDHYNSVIQEVRTKLGRAHYRKHLTEDLVVLIKENEILRKKQSFKMDNK